MDAREIEVVIARRFRLARAPTFVARTPASRHPIIFTHLRSAEALHRRSMDAPREQAFSLQVPLGIPFPWQAWFSGKQRIVSPATPGNAYLFDLAQNPTVALDAPFSTVRFYISQAALDDLAYDGGLRRAEGLYAPSLGCADPIMVGLAQTLVGAMEQPGAGTGLFVDYIALAFHAHILHAYGNVPVGQVSRHGGLAPWQLRRACEYIEANLDGDPLITEVAGVCGLSTTYFAKAFKQTTGAPPHAWLLMRRIERAKRLLSETTLEIAEIALACGFADQSHLSRTFVKRERCSPGKWRRLRRN
jgi:AraC family transcriptional regulator